MNKMYVIKISNGEHAYRYIRETRLYVYSDREKARKYCDEMNEKVHNSYNKRFGYEEVENYGEIEEYRDKAYLIIYKQYLEAPNCHYIKAIESYPTIKQAKQRKRFLNIMTKRTTSLYNRIIGECDCYCVATLNLIKY